MRRSLIVLGAIAIATPLASAAAWVHAGGWSGDRSSWSAHDWRGGYASGGGGSWSAHGAHGGTASGGSGSWSASGAHGGTASGGDGSWRATGTNGHTYYGGPDYWHGGYYHSYSSPTVVNSYGANCYNCGGWNTGGAVVAAGAASAAANPPGTLYGALPAGCSYRPVGSQPYYSCTSGLWFTPAYGANGVYYRVVPAP